MSILSSTNSGKLRVIISEEFLRSKNWRKYASWDNIFVPDHTATPITFIHVNKFVDSSYKEHNVFFGRIHDLSSGIRYIVCLMDTHDYELFVDYEFNHNRKSLDELIIKSGIILPNMSNQDMRLFDNGYFPSVLAKDIELLLSKRT